MAAGLYIAEIDKLIIELSMTNCSDEVWRMADEILKAREGPDEDDGPPLDLLLSPKLTSASIHFLLGAHA